MKLNFLTISRRALTISVLCVGVIFTGCDKKDDETPPPAAQPTPTPTPPKNPEPKFDGGSGTLTAVKVRSFQDLFIEVELDFGIAVGGFYDNPESGIFHDAGTVSCNSNELTKQENNSYAYTPDIANTEGIDFDGNTVTWEVSGSAEVPTFSQTVTFAFPDVKNITSGEIIDKSDGYTFTCGGVFNADSILFLVGDILHTVAGNVTSSTFTSAELSTLEAGPTFIQIAAYSYEGETISGETYYFVKETVVNKSATVQE